MSKLLKSVVFKLGHCGLFLGQKTCMHVHGVFPYLYVLYDGTQPWDRYLRLFANSLDKAINVAQGHASSEIQHVYKITLVSGM